MSNGLRAVLIFTGLLQLLLGVVLLLYQVREPVASTYARWDRIEGMIANDIFDPVRFDAYLVAQGQTPSRLTADLVRASPGSRPGGFDVVSNWLDPSSRNRAPVMVAGIGLVASGFLVALAASRLSCGECGPVRSRVPTIAS